jgi:cysteine desulfurase / selenocysteine lyase
LKIFDHNQKVMLKRMIHLNHAGASPAESVVLDRQLAHLRREQEIGGYAAASECADEHEQVYASVARLLNAPNGSAEIALTESASASWIRLFYSLTAQFTFGDTIYVGRTEYAANAVAVLQVAKRSGARIHRLASDQFGRICVEGAREMMLSDRARSRRQLLCAVHMPTNSGLVNDVEALGEVAARLHVPYLVDACQSVGQWPLDVQRLGDQERVFATFAGRKYMRAPRGTGGLWARLDGLRQLEPALIDHWAAPWVSSDRYEPRNDAKRFELWESNFAGRLALGVASRRTADIGIDTIWQRISAVASYCREQLSASLDDVASVRLPDSLAAEPLSGLVTFYVDGVESADIASALHAASVSCSLSMADSALYDFEERRLPPLVRVSLHHCTAKQEIDEFIERLRAILVRLVNR